MIQIHSFKELIALAFFDHWIPAAIGIAFVIFLAFIIYTLLFDRRTSSGKF
jgi:hypothetical protein